MNVINVHSEKVKRMQVCFVVYKSLNMRRDAEK